MSRRERFSHRDRYKGHRHYRGRPSGPRPHRPPFREKPAGRPMPIGDRCNPMCPFFYCTQRALVISSKPYRGKYIKVPFCRLIGSECIGAECRYASCRINALLPDGRCAKALEKKQKLRSDEELFREMESIEDISEEDLM